MNPPLAPGGPRRWTAALAGSAVMNITDRTVLFVAAPSEQ